MSILSHVILGVVQGAAEFLPISSSGHLVIFQELLNVKPELIFDILVHVGTLIAVLVVLRKKLAGIILNLFYLTQKDKQHDIQIIREAVLAGVACFPAIIAVVFVKDFFVSLFDSVTGVGYLLIVNSVILAISAIFYKRAASSERRVTVKTALLIGCAQVFAIMPGISRSGITITAAMALGIKPKRAFEFSFLMSIPAIAGAFVLEADSLFGLDATYLPGYLAGTLSAAVVGVASLLLLRWLVNKNRLPYFAVYSLLTGLSVLFFL